MKSKILLLLFFVFSSIANSQIVQLTNEQFRSDFNFFWKSIDDSYCYFNKKQCDWQKVKEIYSPALDTINNRDQFVDLLEKMLFEFYDHHALVNTNTKNSYRLVPSGTDIWAEYLNGKPLIVDLRAGFGAQSCGIKPGMEIISINDLPVETAVKNLLPKSLKNIDTEAKNFALRVALAGKHNLPRKITLSDKGKQSDFYPDQQSMQLEHINHLTKVESKIIGSSGYIKINDCLYDNDLIPVFDSVMQSMSTTSSLVIDLRETPSGGNTSVARAIIGWFIDKEHFYQKHEYYAEEKETGIKRSWEEIVSPRTGKFYAKPLVVLCNHWTGSIAEGIVIGFDGLNRPATKIIGTEMARLNGAVYTDQMPESKIRFTFPAERLYHINNSPRENYIPPVFIDLQKLQKSNSDVILEQALDYLKTIK